MTFANVCKHFKCTLFFQFCSIINEKRSWSCTGCLESIFLFNAIEDEIDFESCIYNYFHCNKFKFQICKKKLNNWTLQIKLRICNSDIDPDKYLYIQFNSSGNVYYLEDDFNVLTSNQQISSNFSVLRVNARSLVKSFDNLVLFLNS